MNFPLNLYCYSMITTLSEGECLINYYIVYYYSLIYKSHLPKHSASLFQTATSQSLSASLEISLSYQVVYYYLLDNLVSRPSFVPTVIAALHSSNTDQSSTKDYRMLLYMINMIMKMLDL